MLCVDSYLLPNILIKQTMSSATSEQIEEMLDFLEVHTDFARGHLRNADGRTRAKQLWNDLTHLLNSLGGCVKTVQQWQKVWIDKKHAAKKNAALLRQEMTGTGKGPSNKPPPSSIDLKIMNIMGEGFVKPQTTARVPVPTDINFENEMHKYRLTRSAENSETQRPQEVDVVAEENSVERKATEESPLQTQATQQQARRHRRRTNDIEDSVERRFFQLEVERQNIFKRKIKIGEELLKIKKQKLKIEKQKFEIEKARLKQEQGIIYQLKDVNNSLKEMVNVLKKLPSHHQHDT